MNEDDVQPLDEEEPEFKQTRLGTFKLTEADRITGLGLSDFPAAECMHERLVWNKTEVDGLRMPGFPAPAFCLDCESDQMFVFPGRDASGTINNTEEEPE